MNGAFGVIGACAASGEHLPRHDRASAEAGFTLIETVLAAALFAVLMLTGVEVLRTIAATATQLALRTARASQANIAIARMRADALASVAVWKPASPCGDALELLQRDAGGARIVLFALRDGALVRASAPGPLDPCDPALPFETLAASVTQFAVARVSAAELATHADPLGGANDGALFEPAGVTAVAADAHARDLDGTAIASGNDVFEALLGAGGLVTPVDLVAGNRPSSYTHVLAYACNGRCEAGAPFPELRGGAYTDCAAGYDFAASTAYYVPATFGLVALGAGKQRIVVTSYTVTGGYTFAFAGPAPLALERGWPIAVWPPANSPLAGTIADPYPVAYGSDAIAARGIANVAADLGEPAAFAAPLASCDRMHAEPTFHG